MTLLNPELLWLAPIVAAPIVIHLLNRLRYRRVRWAAIDFLLSNERRAIRRSRLRHLLLMALRVLLLAAALGVALDPILTGAVSELLAGSPQTVVLLDGSASMAAGDLSGSRDERARALVRRTADDLPPSGRLAASRFARHVSSPVRRPLVDREAALALLEEDARTDGAANVPVALASAAEALGRGGGGGTVWLLTDMQAAGWRAGDDGAWARTREALARPGIRAC